MRAIAASIRRWSASEVLPMPPLIVDCLSSASVFFTFFEISAISLREGPGAASRLGPQPDRLVGQRALNPDGLGYDAPEDRRQAGGGCIGPARRRDDQARGEPVARVEQPPAPAEVGLEAGVEIHG